MKNFQNENMRIQRLFLPMLTVLLACGFAGISTIHASSQTDHHPADINQSHKEVQRGISRGSIEMSRAKLIGALSDYGPYLTKALLHTAGALSNLSQLNNTIDFIPVEGEVRDTILADPQGFINSCARVHGRDFYCLEITNGGLFSASHFPNFFRRFYISNQSPTDTRHLAINDSNIIEQIHITLKEKKPIGNILAHSFIKHPLGSYIPPSDVTFIFIIIDRTTQSVYLVAEDHIPGKYKNVFDPVHYGAFLLQLLGKSPSSFNLTGKPGTLGCVSRHRNMESLRSLIKELVNNRSINPLQFDLPNVGHAGKTKEILQKLIFILGDDDDSEAASTAKKIGQTIDIFDAGGLLTDEFVRAFIENPKESAAELPEELHQDVCCLMIQSGRGMFPNFFQMACLFNYDVRKERFITDIVEANRSSDQPVLEALWDAKVLDKTRGCQILFMIIDKDEKRLYFVLPNAH